MCWISPEQRDSAFFYPLRAQLAALDATRLPDLDALNRRLDALRPRPVNAAGMRLRFITQRGKIADYERHVFECGEIPTRRNDLHDVCNALSWLVYPRSKAALNREHLRARGRGRGAGRGPRRDTLTLLDESGAVVVCDDPALGELLKTFRWRELFVERRADVVARLDCFLFGHGLLAKALTPYVGMTAMSVLIDPPAEFAAAAPARRVELVDRALAARLGAAGELATPRALHPLPLLGLPGWWPENNHPEFYEDSRYFRPGRRRRRRG